MNNKAIRENFTQVKGVQGSAYQSFNISASLKYYKNKNLQQQKQIYE